MELIYCLILTASIVYIYDYVAFPRNLLAYLLGKIRGKEVDLMRVKLPKLLECSLCASTWSTLLLLLVLNWKLTPFCLLFGWSTKHIITIFNIIDAEITKILRKAYEYTVR